MTHGMFLCMQSRYACALSRVPIFRPRHGHRAVAIKDLMIVFGGGVTARLGERFIVPIRKVAYANLVNKQNSRQVRIVAGALGDNAGIVGSAVLARGALS